MTEKLERISRFTDNDLDGHEAESLLRDIKMNHELQSHWERYHVIGDALRGELPASLEHRLARRVSAALRDEPAHETPPAQPLHSRRREWGGFAIAASISGVAMFGMLQMNAVTMTAGTELKPQTYQVAHGSVAQSAIEQVSTEVLAMQQEPASVDFAAAHIDEPLMELAAAGEVIDMQVEPGGDNFEANMYDYLVNYTQYAVAAPYEPGDASLVAGVYSY